MTDKADIWMPLYIGDYISSTSRLTTEQHGAYLLLIMDYWKNGALPDSDAVLAQITRLSLDAWSMHRAVLENMFTVAGGEWRHRRIDKELGAAKDRKAAATAKAKAAAEARWGKKSESECSKHAPSNASAMLEQCPSPSPSPSSLKTPTPGKDIVADKPRHDAIEVIDYLNSVTGSKFQKKGKTIGHVNARLDDGHSVDDMKRVVDAKWSEWKDDKKMAQYIRPETIFGASKFPGYLVAAKAAPKSKHSGFDENEYTDHIPDWESDDE